MLTYSQLATLFNQAQVAADQQQWQQAIELCLQAEALALATHLDHPVYDCLYLVLARREVATLLSADQKLLELACRVLP